MITQSFYTLTNTGFITLIDFAWTAPKNTKLPITTPKNYDDHCYHPNIGSSPLGYDAETKPCPSSQCAMDVYMVGLQLFDQHSTVINWQF